MIRLSAVAAFEIDNSKDFTRDLDAQPKLYIYNYSVPGVANREDKLLIQDDSSTSVNKRQFSYAPFWSNTLLGTSNFYPEQSSLALTNYHTNALAQTVLAEATLPSLEYKVAYLYFSRDFLSSSDLVGNAIRLFVRLSNGSEINLAAIVDLKNSTRVTAVPSKLFDNQIYSEALRFEIPDLDFILNSNNTQIVELRNELFGTERPDKIHIEYSAFEADELDVFTDNSLSFTRLNFATINQQTIDVSLTNESLGVDLVFGENNAVLQSSLKHDRYDPETYLNTLKEMQATYRVEHFFNYNVYDSSNDLIETRSVSIRNVSNQFSTVQFRPVVSSSADHMHVDATIRIENEQTGIVIRRTSSLVVTSSDIAKYKTAAQIQLDNLRVENVTNQTIKTVNNIVQSAEVPSFVQLEKRIYVQVEENADELTLLNANFVVKLNINEDVSQQRRTFIKIDNLTIQNTVDDLTTYEIPSIAYNTKAKKYLILDSDSNVITQGKLNKA